MITKTWLILNAALLLVAALSVKSVLDLPAYLKKQKKLTATAIKNTDTVRGQLSTQQTKNAKLSLRKTSARASQSETWPAIRRGSLSTLWQESLFSPTRTEILANLDEDLAGQQDEELPAPPNFELIGILTANDSHVAIIELKSNQQPGRQQMNPRMRRPPMPGGQPQRNETAPTPDNGKSNFTPTFVTIHEGDSLQETGYKVSAINHAEKHVILQKEGLDYKLKLDGSNSNASQRRENQNAYTKTLQDKIKASEAKAATPQPPQNGQHPQNGQPPAPPPGARFPGGFNRNFPQNGAAPQPGARFPNGFNRNFPQNGVQPGSTNPSPRFRQPMRFTQPGNQQ